MQRYASVELRQRVDAAVGHHYDSIFLRLDLILAGRAGRCRCPDCRVALDRHLADLLGALPDA